MGDGFHWVGTGVRLWYRDQGTGPALIFQNGVGVTITFWEDLAARFAEYGYRTVLWDYRGHGRSDPPRSPDEMTLERCVADLASLLDHLGVDQAVLAGHSMGAQVGWEFYRKHTHRVLGLVPTLGTYKDAVSSFFDLPQVSPLVFRVGDVVAMKAPGVVRALTALAFQQPELSDTITRRLHIVNPDLAPRGWLEGYLDHMRKVDPRVFFHLARAIRDHDATDLLPNIHVPVLVIAGERDWFCPPRVAREMAELIPDAELLIVPGGSHAAIIEQPHLMDMRLLRFLEEHVAPAAEAYAAAPG